MILTINTAEVEEIALAVEKEFEQSKQTILGDITACHIWISRLSAEIIRLKAAIAALQLYIQELPDDNGDGDIDGFSFGAPAAVPLMKQGQFESHLLRFQQKVQLLQQAIHDSGV
jgi:hypothetical protein